MLIVRVVAKESNLDTIDHHVIHMNLNFSFGTAFFGGEGVKKGNKFYDYRSISSINKSEHLLTKI